MFSGEYILKHVWHDLNTRTEAWLTQRQAPDGVKLKNRNYDLSHFGRLLNSALTKRMGIKPYDWSLGDYRVKGAGWVIPSILIINDIPEEDLDQDDFMAYLKGLPLCEDTHGNIGYGISLVNYEDIFGKTAVEMVEAVNEVCDTRCGVILCCITKEVKCQEDMRCIWDLKHFLEELVDNKVHIGPSHVQFIEPTA